MTKTQYYNQEAQTKEEFERVNDLIEKNISLQKSTPVSFKDDDLSILSDSSLQEEKVVKSKSLMVSTSYVDKINEERSKSSQEDKPVKSKSLLSSDDVSFVSKVTKKAENNPSTPKSSFADQIAQAGIIAGMVWEAATQMSR